MIWKLIQQPSIYPPSFLSSPFISRCLLYIRAPEVIKQSGHGRQADIWSVGCTVYEMFTGKPPWHSIQDQVSALFHIASDPSPPPFPDMMNEQARDFLLKCFHRDSKERPNASKLLQHPFIRGSTPARRHLNTATRINSNSNSGNNSDRVNSPKRVVVDKPDGSPASSSSG